MTDYRRYPTGSSQQVPAWFLFAVLAMVALTAVGFLYLGTQLAPGANLPVRELRILSRAYDRIDENYLFELDDERRAELLHAAISGMVRKLDRYSLYYPPARAEEYNRNTNGVMTGIGVIVQDVAGEVRLLFPMPGGPAEHAGLKVGDVITAVDGKPVEKTEDAIEIIKGEVDTVVELAVRRGDESLKIPVKRQHVRIASVKWARLLDPEAGIGYVFLQKFTKNSVEEFDVALQQLEVDLGRRLSGLVLDVRRNPGGLLETCLDLTRRFVREGKLVTIQPRNQPAEVHSADPAKCTRPDLALVVLVDEESASASEVMAGALQDHGRARIVGTRTWGKGVVNEVYAWREEKARLKLTTAYYLTPKGRKIERLLHPPTEKEDPNVGGIFPDEAASFADPKDRALVLNGLYQREVPRAYRAAVDALKAQFPEEVRFTEPCGPDKDVQLAHALASLRKTLEEPR